MLLKISNNNKIYKRTRVINLVLRPNSKEIHPIRLFEKPIIWKSNSSFLLENALIILKFFQILLLNYLIKTSKINFILIQKILQTNILEEGNIQYQKIPMIGQEKKTNLLWEEKDEEQLTINKSQTTICNSYIHFHFE